MKLRSHFETDLRWAAAVLIAIVLPVTLPDLTPPDPSDSYSDNALGKLAAVRLCDALGVEARRNTEDLTRVLGDTSKFDPWETVLVLAGPARYPTPAEWSVLLDWIDEGGAVVLAANSAQPEFEVPGYDIAVVELGEPLEVAPDDESGDLILDWGDAVDSYAWTSYGRIEGSGVEPILEIDGTVQAGRIAIGDGELTIVATDSPLTNIGLGRGLTSVITWRLLEGATYIRSVYVFDESLNVSGTPRIVSLLISEPFRPFTMQCLIALLLFAWWQSRPFGPGIAVADPVRDDIVAHADAAGTLHYRQGDGRRLLIRYREALISDLKLRRLKGREDRVLAPIADRMNSSVADVRAVFRETGSNAKAPRDRAAAARLIRRLAEVREASGRPTPQGEN
ncbi:DUF4350 domain-containing protein [Stratiformator vulcanicus]|uniref:DUF4350 domain-containing protein n=1 Tax=Stratiformator vulcanicus TaxID=2527980 RepID=A0A517QXK9_9PLAN|nr:DUF4350 domain-containing protein [Stratiformator vulcanicus]QDT36310.1 hypothetical protein Pan189_06660 [Stratiformator vulcanicus]